MVVWQEMPKPMQGGEKESGVVGGGGETMCVWTKMRVDKIRDLKYGHPTTDAHHSTACSQSKTFPYAPPKKN